MPSDGETSRPSSGSSQADPPGSDEPCSVRDALLLSLKRESPEMPEAPAEPVSTEPERKRRRRRGIRDKAVKLNDDLLGLILPYLSQVSVKHLFILSMVSRDLRASILGSHELWEQLYRDWERKQASLGRSRSIGSDFAVRCLQAMPKWMVKHQPRHLNPRMHRAMPTPYVRPVVGNDWRTAGVPEEMRPSFERFARKVLCLWNIGCCGCCGTRQGKQRAVWTLNMRVCRGCWLERIVSNRTLMQVWRESWRARVECVSGKTCGGAPHPLATGVCELTCFCMVGLWDRLAQAAGERGPAAAGADPEQGVLHPELHAAGRAREVHAGAGGLSG
jgi:hypothetical protein